MVSVSGPVRGYITLSPTTAHDSAVRCADIEARGGYCDGAIRGGQRDADLRMGGDCRARTARKLGACWRSPHDTAGRHFPRDQPGGSRVSGDALRTPVHMGRRHGPRRCRRRFLIESSCADQQVQAPDERGRRHKQCDWTAAAHGDASDTALRYIVGQVSRAERGPGGGPEVDGPEHRRIVGSLGRAYRRRWRTMLAGWDPDAAVWLNPSRNQAAHGCTTGAFGSVRVGVALEGQETGQRGVVVVDMPGGDRCVRHGQRGCRGRQLGGGRTHT